MLISAYYKLSLCALLSLAASVSYGSQAISGTTVTQLASDYQEEVKDSTTTRHTLFSHSPIPVTLEERLQSLQTRDSDIIYEMAASINLERFFSSIDEAFKQKGNSQSGAVAEQVGELTAQLLESSQIDPLEVALLNPPSHPLDQTFRLVHEAFRAKDIEKIKQLLPQLENYPLYDYACYWILKLRLEKDIEDPTIHYEYQKFMDSHDDEYLGDLARFDYLKTLGSRLNLEVFSSIYEKMHLNKSDPELLAWKLIYESQEETNKEALSRLIFKAKELYKEGPVSSPAYKELSVLISQIDSDWPWHRLIILMQKRAWTLAKEAVRELPDSVRPAPIEELIEAIDKPLMAVNKRNNDLSQVDPRFAVLITLRLARLQPTLAAQVAQSFDSSLSAFWKALVWNIIGFSGITNQDPQSESWFDKAPDSLLLRPQLVVNQKAIIEWHARAILRGENWEKLAQYIETMPQELKSSELWSYWLGYSYIQIGKAELGRPHLERVSKNISFYGKLACDALQIPYTFPKTYKKPSPSKVEAWSTNESLNRARTLYRLHLYIEGHREWNWAMRNISGEDFIALAEYAKNRLLIHRMINTSLKSGNKLVAIDQRYPMPHFSLIKQVCDAQKMPYTWVYGLIRQESRFMTGVNSNVGAQGLMQIMPSTAIWVADKLGIVGFKEASLTELEMNIILGSAYLNLLYRDLDSSYVLATAAYNAGPLRARIWRATLTKELSAAIFTETIPFHETRDYVKNVMSNMHTYSSRTDSPIKNFSEFIGVIRPNSELETDLP